MISNVIKKASYYILKEAVDKGETAQNLKVNELVEEMSIRLNEMVKEDY